MKNYGIAFTIPKKIAGKFSLPVLGMGTYGIGGRDVRDKDNDDERDILSIQNALETGITHIDTAESYADGYSEILIGKAIKKYDRKKIFITTKVRRSHLRYDDIIRSAQNSIKRIGIDSIDLYLIHAPNKDIPMKESMKAMDFLVENQIIKNIGVSNFNSELLKEAMSYTKYSIVNNQIHYNLSARSYEKDGTLEFCKKNKILITAYRILGYDQYAPKGEEILDIMSKKYNKTKSQIALRWVLQKQNIVALVKSLNPEHLKDNLGAIGWRIAPEDEKYLGTNFPEGFTMNTPYI